jgi:hypothetical protein
METLTDGTIAWVLHRNCNHVRLLATSGRIDRLAEELRDLIAAMSADLKNELESAYLAVDGVTARISERDEGEIVVIQRIDVGKSSGRKKSI